MDQAATNSGALDEWTIKARQGEADDRDRVADLRDLAADQRDAAADQRDQAADQRDLEARARDESHAHAEALVLRALWRDKESELRDRAAERRDELAAHRMLTGAGQDATRLNEAAGSIGTWRQATAPNCWHHAAARPPRGRADRLAG